MCAERQHLAPLGAAHPAGTERRLHCVALGRNPAALAACTNERWRSAHRDFASESIRAQILGAGMPLGTGPKRPLVAWLLSTGARRSLHTRGDPMLQFFGRRSMEKYTNSWNIVSLLSQSKAGGKFVQKTYFISFNRFQLSETLPNMSERSPTERPEVLCSHWRKPRTRRINRRC